jgi:hypothetical protein
MKKSVLLVIAGAVAALSLWSARRTAPAPPADASAKLLTDRIWIDHVPKNERDTVNVFAAVSEHAVGGFSASSQWRGSFEGFRYEASGGELRLLYPQTGDRETVRGRARRCTEQRMDFCLELEGASRGVKRYYSREGWEIDGASDVAAIEHRLAAVRAQLAAE